MKCSEISFRLAVLPLREYILDQGISCKRNKNIAYALY